MRDRTREWMDFMEEADGKMFREIGSQVDFAAVEQEVLSYWREAGVFEKSLKNREGNQEFVFYDGPPFATGLPHYGHLLAGTIKDVIPRYRTMRGNYVRRTFGWDCHGLPAEMSFIISLFLMYSFCDSVRGQCPGAADVPSEGIS